MINKISKNEQVKRADIQRAARRALMSVNTDYFSLSAQAQETFRATKDEQAIEKIRIVLVNTLLSSQCNASNIDAIWDELSETDIDTLNWATLLTDGVGQDSIFVNESFEKDTSILNFNTVYDYDFNDYLFQEKSKIEASSSYQKKDYFPFRWSPWVRLLINDNFFYSTLTSIASYCSGLLIPDTILGGNMTSEEVFNDKTKKKFYP